MKHLEFIWENLIVIKEEIVSEIKLTVKKKRKIDIILLFDM